MSLRHIWRGARMLQVTLIVPWLAKCDQELTFIDGVTFDTPDEQEEFMGRWITKRTGLTPKYRVKWYSGASSHSAHALVQRLLLFWQVNVTLLL